jgi:hypothetical protein
MKLKDFIKEALVNVVEGVREANDIHQRFQLSGGYHHRKNIDGQEVEFDISVIVKESSEENKKASILVALANLGAGKSKENKHTDSSQNMHRLKFKVFITEK